MHHIDRIVLASLVVFLGVTLVFAPQLAYGHHQDGHDRGPPSTTTDDEDEDDDEGEDEDEDEDEDKDEEEDTASTTTVAVTTTARGDDTTTTTTAATTTTASPNDQASPVVEETTTTTGEPAITGNPATDAPASDKTADGSVDPTTSPSPREMSPVVSVPPVAGLTEKAARDLISRLGLTVGGVYYLSGLVHSGLVVSHSVGLGKIILAVSVAFPMEEPAHRIQTRDLAAAPPLTVPAGASEADSSESWKPYGILEAWSNLGPGGQTAVSAAAALALLWLVNGLFRNFSPRRQQKRPSA